MCYKGKYNARIIEVNHYRGKRLVNAEFAAIALAHNIREMIAKGYCICSEVAVG